MKVRYGFSALLAVLLAGYASLVQAELRVRPVEWAQPVVGVSLGNFYRVSDELYRSRQPDVESMTTLAHEGIRSVLSLREYHSDKGKTPPGMNRYQVPMNAGDVTDAEIEKAMVILARAPKPVLVHCWHGSDRTGVVVAMYRMVFQGWPREQAIDEFENGGFGYHKSVYPNIEKYLQNVDIDHFRKLVADARAQQ